MYKIGIIGAKNSGKTTLIEKLVTSLSKRDLSIMTVKHTSHKHNFDTVGKDSYRHRNSGAQLTLAVNPSEFAIFSANDTELLKMFDNYTAGKFDICLIEGDKFSDIPKIILTRNIELVEIDKINDVCATYGCSDIYRSNRHFNENDIEQLSLFILERGGLLMGGSAK